jgi:hypothetical protein
VKRERQKPPTPPPARDGPGPNLQLVKRHCEVCEWAALLIEPAGSTHLCQWCRAPTRVTVVIEQVEGLSSSGSGKNPYAAALGRLGGLKGGHARAAALSSKERQEIARKAANTRWARTRRGNKR